MNQQPEFERIVVSPGGFPGLTFSCFCPKGWQQIPLPEEEPHFEEPTSFMPLTVLMAPWGAVLFSVGARPAYGDGTVREWMTYLCEAQEIRIEAERETALGGLPAWAVEANQESEAGPMQLRTVLLEDGGRLYTLTGMAPQPIWPSVEAIFAQLLDSVRLAQVAGPTVALYPGWQAGSAPEVMDDPALDEAIVTEDPRQVANEAPASPNLPTLPAQVALADDASSLDPDHPLNARLRDNGVGLVPRILSVDLHAKAAEVAASAIEATFQMPLGWHVIDDGRRTLVFDADGRMQINLDLRRARPEEHPALLDQILREMSAEHSELEAMTLELAGMQCLALRNLRINGEDLQQCYLLRDVGHPELTLVCRVTASEADIAFAMDTAEVILTSVRRAAEPEPEAVDPGPEWWVEAQTLERQDRLAEAEGVLERAIHHLGVYSQIAYLYELRMQRLLQAGDTAGAQAAGERATDWLYQYASCATSGGEGIALSAERDQRVAAIRAALGRPNS